MTPAAARQEGTNSPDLRAWIRKGRCGDRSGGGGSGGAGTFSPHAARCVSPPARTDPRVERPTWLKGQVLFQEECRSPFLPDTAAGVRAEREDQGSPAADVDSPVEAQGCSAPSSGAPGDSDLPSITASEHASTHAHAPTELPLATAAEPRQP